MAWVVVKCGLTPAAMLPIMTGHDAMGSSRRYWCLWRLADLASSFIPDEFRPEKFGCN